MNWFCWNSLSLSLSLSLTLSALVRVTGRGASALHPPQLPAECGGQRGAHQVLRGLPRPGQRGQALPHAAARAPGDADATHQAPAVCRWAARPPVAAHSDRAECKSHQTHLYIHVFFCLLVILFYLHFTFNYQNNFMHSIWHWWECADCAGNPWLLLSADYQQQTTQTRRT